MGNAEPADKQNSGAEGLGTHLTVLMNQQGLVKSLKSASQRLKRKTLQSYIYIGGGWDKKLEIWKPGQPNVRDWWVKLKIVPCSIKVDRTNIPWQLIGNWGVNVDTKV